MTSHHAARRDGSALPGEPRRNRVVTLTPSPVADRIYFVDTLRTGQVNRALGVSFHLGGNGVNVARTLQLAGCRVRGVLPLAPEDDPDGALLGDHPGLFVRVNVLAPMRVNTVLVAADGVTTNANQRAGTIEASDWNAVVGRTLKEIRALDADWLLVAGSLPRLPAGGIVPMAGLFNQARRLGVRVCVDVNGPDLLPLVETGLVDLAKPNTAELAQSWGGQLNTVGDVHTASRWLQGCGAAAVAASMGEDGVLGVYGEDAFWAQTSKVRVVNTTGAGDSALAGLLAYSWDDADQLGFSAAVALAASWGALAVTQPTAELTSLTSAPQPTLQTPVAACPLSTPDNNFEKAR